MSTYRIKHLTQTVDYELHGQSLHVTAASPLGKVFESTFDVAQLDPQPFRVWTRNEAVQQAWSIALMLVAFGPVVYLGLMGDKVVEFHPVRYIWVWAVAIAVCVAGWALAPRVEHATFRFRSGEPAVAVTRSGSEQHGFDQFVAEVSEAATRRQ